MGRSWRTASPATSDPTSRSIVNTGDDLELHGLAIWPDHDTVAYTLADLDDEIRGWGLRGESWTVMDRLEELGELTWFRLGDRDLATHLWRTDRLRAGDRPTVVALALQQAMGISSRVLPMADEPVRTEVLTADGWLEFQEYFVHRHQEPAVHEVRFRGVEAAHATPEALAAFDDRGRRRHRPVQPDRLDRADPRGPRDPPGDRRGHGAGCAGRRDQRDRRWQGAERPGRSDAGVVGS